MKRSAKFLLLPALFVMTGAGVAMRPPTPSLTHPYVAPAVPAFCDGHCHDCTSGGNAGHDFHATTPKDREGTDHECYTLQCDAWHPLCEGSDDAASTSQVSSAPVDSRDLVPIIVGAAREVARGEVSSLLGLLREYPALATYNPSRGALQISAPCSRLLVIAHVPLTIAQRAAIVAAEAAN